MQPSDVPLETLDRSPSRRSRVGMSSAPSRRRLAPSLRGGALPRSKHIDHTTTLRRSLDGRSLETMRPLRARNHSGRPRSAVPFSLGRSVIDQRPNPYGRDIVELGPVPSTRGAKVLTRNARSTKRKRAIWDATFPKLCKNGLRLQRQ